VKKTQPRKKSSVRTVGQRGVRREGKEARRKRALEIVARLKQEYPDAKCSLTHRNPFELLVATILSAQCTDERVNLVTPALFKRFPSAADMADARTEELEELIKSTGFFRNKTKSLLGMSNALVERHQGQVPDDMDELVELPGVGRKTANVVLGNAFSKAVGVVVDTHVSRKLHAAVWSAIGAAVIGFLGYMVQGPIGLVIGLVGGFILIWFVVTGMADSAGRAAGSVIMPSGATTPGPREYSQGAALAAAGKLPAAIREYEQNSAHWPLDPEPRVRLARLYRDQMRQYENAAYWFIQVLQIPQLAPATQGAITRELAELYMQVMNEPTRALPILARLAAEQPSTPAGSWARTELAELKHHLNQSGH
jgi:endonuclease III